MEGANVTSLATKDVDFGHKTIPKDGLEQEEVKMRSQNSSFCAP